MVSAEDDEVARVIPASKERKLLNKHLTSFNRRVACAVISAVELKKRRLDDSQIHLYI